MAFCVNCGNQMQDGMKFCPVCGTPALTVQPQYTAPIQQEVPQYTAPIQQEVPQYTAPIQQEVPQYTAPIQQEVPQYTAPVQQEIPQYTAPIQQEPIKPEVPKYTAPEPEYVQPRPEPEYNEPETAPEQEYIPPSRPKAVYARYENNSEEDLDMDAPPITGNYTIPAEPVPETGGTKKKAAGNKRVKQSTGKGSRIPVMIGIVGGAAIVIAVLALVIVKVVGGMGGTNVKGKGNALKELIEMAADNSYSEGQGDVFTVDEDYGYDVEESKEESEDEAPGETSSGGEQLYQGWFYATLPEGYIPEREGTENEFMNENNHDEVIKLFICTASKDKPSARGAAEEDVRWWTENKGEDCGYEIVDDVTIGDYTWVTEHFPWNGGQTSVNLYTDLDDKHYIYVACFTMDENHEDVQEFIKSIRLADGDPYENYYAWKQSKWANE
ncbi:MAG: zinc-ribbon domain-containing protein [Lachnospiraceae bacterium]|nr:zinc-ribbon domain-containing protein [Lachnospiraceae bacterium]